MLVSGKMGTTTDEEEEMGRTIGAVLAGTVLWGVLWNGGNAGLSAAMPDLLPTGEPITNAGVLVGLIAYSVVLSALAGFVAAAIKGEPDAMTAVKALAGVNLLIGIVVEVMYWSLMPVWYHLVFLALVVPATLWGGARRAS